LVPKAVRVFLTPIQSERSANLSEVLSYCAGRWPRIQFTVCDSSANALRQARFFPFVVVAGSLYLAGEVMQQLGLAPGAGSERELNEWDAGNRNNLPASA
jgi:folylpolyglutamate synthase/dihydropteroate synthase